MSERNVIKARTCTECDVNHTMVSNAFGLKKHAREVYLKRIMKEQDASKEKRKDQEKGKVGGAAGEKVLRTNPEESPAGYDPAPNTRSVEHSVYEGTEEVS